MTVDPDVWDVAVVGAGPAGSSAALGALAADPGLRVLLLDRADLPRDKACGDGVAPHVLDVLAGVGVTGLLDDRVPVQRLVLRSGGDGVDGLMRRPAYVVPRTVLDARIAQAAVRAGAHLRRARVRSLSTGTAPRTASPPRGDQGRVADVPDHRGGGGTSCVTAAGGCVTLVTGHDDVRARVVVGADGASSRVRAALGLPSPRHVALAIRGYAPVRPQWQGRQAIVFADGRGSSAYAWTFDRGDGLANVGFGQVLRRGRPAPSRAGLTAELDRLLPGVAVGASAWRGHHLPLATGRVRRHPDGRVLLAGDAASLVNPMTGEGIYDAVVSGVLAGRAAAASLARGDGSEAGRRYRRAMRSVGERHYRHTGLAARLVRSPAVVGAGLRAAADDPRVFDDLVEVGLAHGTLTPSVVTGLARHLLPPQR